MKIVDCFPFFAPYNEELLYLRVNLLKDYVDKFIIVESNKTHSGKPLERKFLEIAKKLKLPLDKIIYVEHDIPETKDLEILQLDAIIAGRNADKEEKLFNRVRERSQKDAVMQALDQFDDDDIFIYGDSDEIINPEYINWIASTIQNNKEIYVRVPLIYLQGRADMRVYLKNGKPDQWDNGMFAANKKTIVENSILTLRVGFNETGRTNFVYLMQDGIRVEDMGWHFCWMGNKQQRQIKADNFSHSHDNFPWQESGMDGYADYAKFSAKFDYVEGQTAPDGNVDHIVKSSPLSVLPDLIFETPFVKDFLLPKK